MQFAERGCEVNLWGRNQTLMGKTAATRYNEAYLPDTRLPDEIKCHQNFAAAVSDGDILLVATPTVTIRPLIERINPILSARHLGIAWACKGVEADSGCWIHEVVSETLADELPLAAVSGPSFAHEVAAGLPTALVIACEQKPFADTLAELLHGDKLRVYTTDDMIGVECGGALKKHYCDCCRYSRRIGIRRKCKSCAHHSRYKRSDSLYRSGRRTRRNDNRLSGNRRYRVVVRQQPIA